MDDQQAFLPRWRLRRDLTLLVLLVLITAGLRAWQVGHTEVAARDSIGFIREAWRLREQPWGEVVRTSEQHPGYPILLLAISWPVRQMVTGSDAATMQLSAQMASALASILLVFPMYYLGKELFNRAVGFWAAFLFQTLPTSSRILADGLSEATFLLFAGTSLLLAVLAFRKQSKLLFGLAGLASGLAYLTRPEGAAILAATGVVLVGLQVKRSTRWPWVRVITCGVSLVAGWALIGGPFIATTGHFTLKNTGLQIVQPGMVSPAPMPPDQKEVHAQKSQSVEPDSSGPLLEKRAMSWTGRLWESPMIWGLRKVAMELQKGFFYVAWIPAVLGLWWYRMRTTRGPGHWVLLLVSAAMLVLLYRVASYMHYLSDRHAVLFIYCCCFWSALGVLAIGRKLATIAQSWTERQEQTAIFARGIRLIHDPRLWSGLLLFAFTGAVFIKDVEPLHANRKGFRDAGAWIAEHARPSDEVIDPYCWTHYYAGRVFLEDRPLDLPTGQARVRYIVVDESGNEHPRLKIDPEILRTARQGQRLFEYKATQKKDSCDVSIYAVPGRP